MDKDKITYVTIQVPVGSFISPPGDLHRRIKAAQDYIDNAELLSAEGPVYSESGYYWKDVMEAINIAAGLSPKSEDDSSPS